jgi:hypothetical protein
MPLVFLRDFRVIHRVFNGLDLAKTAAAFFAGPA